MKLVDDRNRNYQSRRKQECGRMAQCSGTRQKYAEWARERMRANRAVYHDLQRQGLEQSQRAGQQAENEKPGDVRPTWPRLPHKPAAENQVAMCGGGHQLFLAMNPASESDRWTVAAAPAQSRSSRIPSMTTAAARKMLAAGARAPAAISDRTARESI